MRQEPLSIWIDEPYLDMAQDFDEPWILHSFSHKHINCAEPDRWLDVESGRDSNGDPYFVEDEAKYFHDNWKFVLSYYEHGIGIWSLKGEGPQCQWDTAQIAGILEPRDMESRGWEEYFDKEPHKRRAAARKWLQQYNDWAAGLVYEVRVDDELLDGGPWFSHEYNLMLKAVRAILREEGMPEYTLCGDAAALFRDDLSQLCSEPEEVL